MSKSDTEQKSELIIVCVVRTYEIQFLCVFH